MNQISISMGLHCLVCFVGHNKLIFSLIFRGLTENARDYPRNIRFQVNPLFKSVPFSIIPGTV